MKTGKSITELAQEIQKQAESKRDYIADTRDLVLTETGKLSVGDFGTFDSTWSSFQVL